MKEEEKSIEIIGTPDIIDKELIIDGKIAKRPLPDKAKWRYSTHLSKEHGNRKQPVAAKRPDGSMVITSYKNAEKQGWEILRFVTPEEYKNAALVPSRDLEASYIKLLEEADRVGGVVKLIKTRSGYRYVIEKL